MARGETDDTQDFNATTKAGDTAPAAATEKIATTADAATVRKAVLRTAAPGASTAAKPTAEKSTPKRPTSKLTDTQLTETQATGITFDDDDDDWGRPPPRDTGTVEPEAVGAGVAGHRRGPRLWLPLILFVVLLVGTAVVGRFVVPATVPAPGAAPPAAGTHPTGTGDGSTPDSTPTTGPAVATPPARAADSLAGWAGQLTSAVEIPEVALQAYGYAQLSVQGQTPGCHLTWTTLAGIGSVESNHGQAGGAVLASTGRSTPPILGPALDGKGGRALVADTDAGAFDGDTTFDHAMGPLGILPSAWRAEQIDADGDGILDPYDIDDAALAMARLLCSGNDDMAQRAGWMKAVARQHTGTAYAQSVFNAADSYGQRTRDIG
jgi:hypothetical protein